MKVEIRPGAVLRRALLSREEQEALVAEIMERSEVAPFYRMTMPRTGKPLSAEMTNFGALGWVSDIKGYRYEAKHPVTGNPWPAMPEMLLKLWNDLCRYPAPPEACLVNLYREGARMGLHQDRNEKAMDAPVLSVSLGDDAIYRIGGAEARAPTSSVTLHSGDVFVMGGAARLCRHGIDRIRAGSSRLVSGGGRISLTLRRVTPPTTKTAGQGTDRPSNALSSAGTGRG